jgi:hypothetical protein
MEYEGWTLRMADIDGTEYNGWDMTDWSISEQDMME